MWIPLGIAEWCIPFWVTLTLTFDLISSFLYLEDISFIVNNVSQMCLMLDQFLWGIRHVIVPFLVVRCVFLREGGGGCKRTECDFGLLYCYQRKLSIMSSNEKSC